MSDETERNNQIALFMEISGKRQFLISVSYSTVLLIVFKFHITFKGADFDTAKQILTLNNFNLEQAINSHLERSNSIGDPEDDVAGKRVNYYEINLQNKIYRVNYSNLCVTFTFF